MSYNITSWKTLEIKNLIITLSSIQQINDSLREDWRLDFKTDLVWKDWLSFELQGGSEGFEMSGCLDVIDTETFLNITSITNIGEGSGTWYRDFLEPLLSTSSGLLKIRLVWEGGDTIEKVTWENGVSLIENMDDV